MKTREDNDVTVITSAVYVENNIELSWSIKSGVDFDQNQIGKQHDLSYRCYLHRKQN